MARPNRGEGVRKKPFRQQGTLAHLPPFALRPAAGSRPNRSTASMFLVALTLMTMGSCTFAFDLNELSMQCPEGEMNCNGTCVPIDDPTTGCGNENCKPCPTPHGAAKCEGNKCVLDTCYYPWENCDGNPSNGCEVNVATDLNHCGQCFHAVCENVSFENVSEYACLGSPNPLGNTCGIAECASGFEDCDGNPTNGCEENLSLSSRHCGMCNDECDANEQCVEGRCTALGQ